MPDSELEQRRRNVRVLDLLTRSYEAHSRGDRAAADAAATEAAECDANVFSVVTGGMRIGAVPRPEEDWPGWMEYVAANRDALADLEAGDG